MKWGSLHLYIFFNENIWVFFPYRASLVAFDLKLKAFFMDSLQKIKHPK